MACTTPSYIRDSKLFRYVCNTNYLIGALISAIVVACIIYFSTGMTSSDNHSQNDLPTPSKWANNEEIRLFREYLRIPTVHPNIDYGRISHALHTIILECNRIVYHL